MSLIYHIHVGIVQFKNVNIDFDIYYILPTMHIFNNGKLWLSNDICGKPIIKYFIRLIRKIEIIIIVYYLKKLCLGE